MVTFSPWVRAVARSVRAFPFAVLLYFLFVLASAAAVVGAALVLAATLGGVSFTGGRLSASVGSGAGFLVLVPLFLVIAAVGVYLHAALVHYIGACTYDSASVGASFTAARRVFWRATWGWIAWLFTSLSAAALLLAAPVAIVAAQVQSRSDGLLRRVGYAVSAGGGSESPAWLLVAAVVVAVVCVTLFVLTVGRLWLIVPYAVLARGPVVRGAWANGARRSWRLVGRLLLTVFITSAIGVASGAVGGMELLPGLVTAALVLALGLFASFVSVSAQTLSVDCVDVDTRPGE